MRAPPEPGEDLGHDTEMTLRAVLACAVVLTVGCGKRQPDDAVAIAPAKPASPAPATPADAGAQAAPRAPASPARPGDRCRAAIDHVLAVSAIPDKTLVEKLATILTEACRSDGWSDELLACFERGRDEKALATCKPTAAQEERLRTRLAPLTGTDAGASIAGAPGSAATPEPPAPSALEARMLGYAKLLAIDVALFQLIRSYPGAPAGTTFDSSDYRWLRHTWLSLDAMQKEIEAILASTSTTPSLAADAAVQAYAAKLAGWMPRLIALTAYYTDQKFVDDEFDRGRKEAEDVRRTAAELAKLRAPMRASVFGAYRDLVAGYRESPRAAVASAWMACMSIADRVMEQARPEAIAKAVSECRRSIPRLTTAASTSGFDTDVRSAAVVLGDWVAIGSPSWRSSITDELGRLTLRYIELWPKLPTTPAEKPAP